MSEQGRPSIIGPAVIFCIVSGLAMALFWATSWYLTGTSTGLDERILIDLRVFAGRAGPKGGIYELMICATALGAFPTLCLVVLFTSGLLALTGRPTQALLLVARCLGGIAVANLLKDIVNRPRPVVVTHWTGFSSSSFPSGHSADATIVWLLLAALTQASLYDVAARRFVFCCAVALAVLVGVSRVFLGVHWPTDVLGGWFVGSAWVIACLAPSWSRRSVG